MPRHLQSFYTTKLEEQLSLIERDYGDGDAIRLWEVLKPTIPSMFEGLDDVKPSLQHGDLWAGNMALVDGQPSRAIF